MKTVKSALLGNKQLTDTNPDVQLMQLKEIIQWHRSIIITRLVKDLGTYLAYKFEAKISKDMLLNAKDRLLEMRDASVDLKAYDNVVQQLMSRAVVHLTNEPFYKEIDAAMTPFVSQKNLEIV
jgi:glucan phosphorylase